MVSIVMPAYNAERYIERAVRSVMQQTYIDWELLIIDDQSTDGTYNIVERLSKEDLRIKLFRNERNMGVAITRNRGLDLSTGEYVALLDSDDVWLEDKLSRQLDLIASSGADIVYCSYRIVDETGNRKCADFIVPQETNYEEALTTSVISCSTVVMSREIVDKYRFSSDYYHEDLVLWLQLLRDGYKAYGVVEILAEYRVFAGTRASNKAKSMMNRFKIYHYYLKLPLYKSGIFLIRAALVGLRKYKHVR